MQAGWTPQPRETTHVYLCLDKIQPSLEKWLSRSAIDGAWSKNGIRSTFRSAFPIFTPSLEGSSPYGNTW